ncbi:MAG: hypothetical protein Q9217_004471 [Psora testacea]
MPPFSHTLTQKAHLSGRTLDFDIQEERKLLGRSYSNNDAKAVTIKKPSTNRWGTMPARVVYTPTFCEAIADKLKLAQGGPRPTNTLNRSSNLPDIRSNRNSTPTYPASKQKKLDLTAVRGDNVSNNPKFMDLTDEFSGPPSAKRRKLEAIHSPSTSSTSMDEAFKSISGDQFRVTASQTISRAPSSQEQKCGLTFRTKPSSGRVDEYRTVEGMMCSNTKRSNKKRDHSDGSQSEKYDFSKSSSPLMDALPRSNSMIAVDDDMEEIEPFSPAEPLHSGIARTSAKRNGPSVAQNADSHTESLPHLSSASGQRQGLDSKQVKHTNPELHFETPLQCIRLNRVFVQADGRRRGGLHPASSPDELTSGTTVGNQTDPTVLAPSKRPRIGSPSKETSSTLELSGLVEHNMGLERSNIRAAKFATARSQKTTSPAEEAAPPCSYDLVAINLPATGIYHQQQDLGFVHDEKNDIYTVYQRGGPAKFPGITSQIAPRKLIKVQWERDGRKIRFESSRSGNEDNVLDLEFSSEKDASDLLKRLQRHVGSIKILSIPRYALTVDRSDMPRRLTRESSEKINSMFERRRNEQRPHNMTSRNAASQRVDAISLPQRTPVKNGRTATKLIDSLMSKARIEDSLDLKAAPCSSAKPNSLIPEQTGQRSSISNILNGLKPEHNGHLRRSTRTSDAPKWLTADKRDMSEEPEAPKYSKVHGLGPKWKKPLTYPKIGKKKATVDWVDLERLDEGEFLNDTLVTFYMRYLEHKIEQQNPGLAERIYFFSTFFYERLTSTMKGKKEINYGAVQKWTRTVDIFTYDYVVVPINEQAHWYLAIICNLPALDRSMGLSDDDTNTKLREQPITSSPPTSRGSEMSPMGDSEPIHAHREASTEKGTTESFAELSLDNNRERPYETYTSSEDAARTVKAFTSIQESKEADQEMSDVSGQILSDISELKNPAERIARREDVSDPIEDNDHKPKASAAVKKQKRKSLPPITHIDPRQPLVITFDSLGNPHGIVIKVLKDYLLEESKAKRGGMEFDIGSIRGINAKSIPHQDNFSDCGLYMLGYVEKFLLDNPPDFIGKIIRREYTNEDWSKLVPSDMRTSLRVQLQELHKMQDEEYKATKAKKRSAGDASSPLSSAPPAPETPREHVSTKPTSSRDSPAAATATSEVASNADHAIEEAITDEATDQVMGKPLPQTQVSPHQGKRRRSHIPVAEFPEGDSSVICLDDQCSRQRQLDLPRSQLISSAQQQTMASDPPELPTEIEDSQAANSVAPATPPPAEYASTPSRSPEVVRHAAGSPDPWSLNHSKELTTYFSNGRKLGRPKKHKPEVQTVVLDE